MKKAILYILSSFLLLGLFACSNEQKNHNDVRQSVWEQLPSEQKKRIKRSDWKEAEVSKVTLDENMMNFVDDKSYEGKEVYIVDFPTYVYGGFGAYADVDSFKYIGFGAND